MWAQRTLPLFQVCGYGTALLGMQLPMHSGESSSLLWWVSALPEVLKATASKGRELCTPPQIYKMGSLKGSELTFVSSRCLSQVSLTELWWAGLLPIKQVASPPLPLFTHLPSTPTVLREDLAAPSQAGPQLRLLRWAALAFCQSSLGPSHLGTFDFLVSLPQSLLSSTSPVKPHSLPKSCFPSRSPNRNALTRGDPVSLFLPPCPLNPGFLTPVEDTVLLS